MRIAQTACRTDQEVIVGKGFVLLVAAALSSVGVMAQTAGAFIASPGVDLSGNWAPVIHEDFGERIPGPELANYAVPL